MATNAVDTAFPALHRDTGEGGRPGAPGPTRRGIPAPTPPGAATGGGGEQPGVPEEEDEDWTGVLATWRPVPSGDLVDRRDALALRAVSSVPPSRRDALEAHLSAVGRPPESWTHRPPGARFASAPRLGGYLRGLDAAVTGAGGQGLGPFLEWLLVRSQALSLTWTGTYVGREAAWSRDRPWWPPRPFGLERYLPGTRVAPRGWGLYRFACCPFHDDRTPSFAYLLEHRQWHCYGCGVQETHWSLVARALRLDGREAVDLLRRSAGYPPPPWQLPAPRRNRALRLWGWTLPHAES